MVVLFIWYCCFLFIWYCFLFIWYCTTSYYKSTNNHAARLPVYDVKLRLIFRIILTFNKGLFSRHLAIFYWRNTLPIYVYLLDNRTTSPNLHPQRRPVFSISTNDLCTCRNTRFCHWLLFLHKLHAFGTGFLKIIIISDISSATLWCIQCLM